MLIVGHKSIWASSIYSPHNWTLSSSSFTLSTIIDNLCSFSANLMMTDVRINVMMTKFNDERSKGTYIFPILDCLHCSVFIAKVPVFVKKVV